MDFCKGRIPPDTLQIPLEAPKILPLSIFSVYTPVNEYEIESIKFWAYYDGGVDIENRQGKDFGSF